MEGPVTYWMNLDKVCHSFFAHLSLLSFGISGWIRELEKATTRARTKAKYRGPSLRSG
jgi:hypothetical protein